MFPKLYAITDPLVSRMSHLDQVERLIAGGATLIQLRDKSSSPNDFYDSAVGCIRHAHACGARIIINDRVDIAIAAAADGVHLGQDDLDPIAARRLLGPERIVGFSTHSLLQASEADRLPIDYIAIGPVFPTATKSNPDPVVGIELVAALRGRVSKPIVAIGGIVLARAREVIEAGADSVAVISDLYKTGSIEQRTKEYLLELQG
ncbi:MAG TPA: thiamine phosphate synthase [Blastocatellia bacterium]